MSEELVRVAVDADVCIGAGQCEMAEAELFEVDEHTAIAKVLPPGLLERQRAEMLIDRCPSGAISIAE